MCVYIHTYIHIYIYIHIHTHTRICNVHVYRCIGVYYVHVRVSLSVLLWFCDFCQFVGFPLLLSLESCFNFSSFVLVSAWFGVYGPWNSYEQGLGIGGKL